MFFAVVEGPKTTGGVSTFQFDLRATICALSNPYIGLFGKDAGTLEVRDRRCLRASNIDHRELRPRG
jgi:hypothetical protein